MCVNAVTPLFSVGNYSTNPVISETKAQDKPLFQFKDGASLDRDMDFDFDRDLDFDYDRDLDRDLDFDRDFDLDFDYDM